MFHVTKAENAAQIWRNGVRQRAPNAQWVEQRQEMRQLVDKVGNETHNDWVNREGAVFLWPTHNGAIRYADRLLEPAIVEVHLSSPNAWCLPNTELEIFFDSFRDSQTQQEKEILKENAQKLVDTARPWNGQRDDRLEVWMQPPIPQSAIHRITDTTGQPLDFE